MRHEPTFNNAARRVNIAKYCQKYGNAEGIIEMVYHYNLRKDETRDLIEKALMFELITEDDVEPIKKEFEL